MRVILDTNVWVSFLLTNRMSFIDDLFTTDEIMVLSSVELIHELTEVIARPKFQKALDLNKIESLLLNLKLSTEQITITSLPEKSRDLKDNYLLAMAEFGQSNYLVTGDNDLLILTKYGSTKIITPSEFQDILKSEQKNK